MTFAMANGVALERLLEPEALPDTLMGEMMATFFTGPQAPGAAPATARRPELAARAESTARTRFPPRRPLTVRPRNPSEPATRPLKRRRPLWRRPPKCPIEPLTRTAGTKTTPDRCSPLFPSIR